MNMTTVVHGKAGMASRSMVARWRPSAVCRSRGPLIATAGFLAIRSFDARSIHTSWGARIVGPYTAARREGDDAPALGCVGPLQRVSRSEIGNHR